MKSLKESLFDDDLVTKDVYLYHPKSKLELIDCIEKELDSQGPNADLNLIDVSGINDMSFLFKRSSYIKNIDISLWDVSNVTNMNGMFYGCEKFTSDLSKWDVGNVEDMSAMFYGCEKFTSDLSKWDVGNVLWMNYMFYWCKKFTADLSKWNVRSVFNMNYMFDGCRKFNSDLSKWNVKDGSIDSTYAMFRNCKSLKKIPSWYHEEP